MPVPQPLPQSHHQENVQFVPVEPQVKGAETCQLSNNDAGRFVQIAKSADPTCYNSPTVELTGLFENVERTMQRFKRGDAVWVFSQNEFGYPTFYPRPGVITQKVHPTCYVVAYVSNDCRRPREQWKMDGKGRQRHPTDMLYYSDTKPYEDNYLDAQEHYKELEAEWRRTASPEKIAAWDKQQAENKRASDEINRRLRPVFERMFA